MNKKNILFFSLLIFCATLFAQKFQIVDVEYNLEGAGPKLLGITNPYALEQKVSIDKKTVFSSEEEFNKYFEDYKKQINNLRAFEKIEISYSVLEQQDEINYVKINVQLKDSIHILAVPYLKYDSNTGLTFKLKAKDTNFLGSLNSMSTDLNFAIENNEELETKKTKIGFNFNYDYPFSLGLFNSTWVNDFEFSYAIGEKIPEWYAKTGLKLELPKDDYSYLFEVYQYSIHDTDYIDFNDEYYFSEEAKFSVPITLTKLDILGKIIYKPYNI
jgi:outer membrane protein assembly factor BamA